MKFVYFEFDILPRISDNKEPFTVIELQEVQTELQGPESHSEATELMPTNSKGLKTQIEQLEPEVEIENEDNAIHSKVK